ncbi:MAG: hypothetical protein F6K54_05700 [Okeania sp. SIO3B5]|uniref:hypothetical protein n=1 Tax=Okeania sp. SIO3B5 TaxID=2607811 RepID=UPI001400BCC5|nr:hypothetical protein [Okeania sp. SIO3B5]NEO52612.1 hypothetical protein [Okeania sp. SIO3B5]
MIAQTNDYRVYRVGGDVVVSAEYHPICFNLVWGKKLPYLKNEENNHRCDGSGK